MQYRRPTNPETRQAAKKNVEPALGASGNDIAGRRERNFLCCNKIKWWCNPIPGWIAGRTAIGVPRSLPFSGESEGDRVALQWDLVSRYDEVVLPHCSLC